ncbi:MAG: Fur family transcriptional regulator [Candidatus Thermoplasmatota archaeon]
MMFDKYIQLLKDHNLKITHQRLEVLRYLDEHRDHPTVEKIYTALKKREPSLSKTTVYNAVDKLKEEGVIQAINISGELRYDIKKDMHHHFLCTVCGSIIDIDISCQNIDKITKQGYVIKEVHGYFKGRCKECQGMKE